MICGEMQATCVRPEGNVPQPPRGQSLEIPQLTVCVIATVMQQNRVVGLVCVNFSQIGFDTLVLPTSGCYPGCYNPRSSSRSLLAQNWNTRLMREVKKS